MANAVDVDEINPGASSLKEQLKARFVVAYMGRLDPEKRVGALIDAFLGLDWPEDHVLVVAGTGSVAGKLRRHAEGHSAVRFLGMVHSAEQRRNILRGADIFVLPSTAEGLALSLLEAMAAGCAVIATDTGEDAAALAESGVVIPVRPLHPHLSTALRELRDDGERRQTLGIRARHRAEQHFSLAKQAAEIRDLYAALGVAISTGSATMTGDRLA
jgi:glycosyltransferase involved in cell wall biosynthesis